MSNETQTKSGPFVSGNLLVASPFVTAEPYRQTVVLLTRHDSRGAGGLVLRSDLPGFLREIAAPQETTIRRGNLATDDSLRLVTAVVVWPAGTLEREVEQGVWLVTSGQLEPPLQGRDLWSTLVRQVGADILRRAVGSGHFQGNSQWN